MATSTTESGRRMWPTDRGGTPMLMVLTTKVRGAGASSMGRARRWIATTAGMRASSSTASNTVKGYGYQRLATCSRVISRTMRCTERECTSLQTIASTPASGWKGTLAGMARWSGLRNLTLKATFTRASGKMTWQMGTASTSTRTAAPTRVSGRRMCSLARASRYGRMARGMMGTSYTVPNTAAVSGSLAWRSTGASFGMMKWRARGGTFLPMAVCTLASGRRAR
mmetsp:Transcript_76285/g.210541  ORF Transcript_76285/g.210541 Transcript_76285/m.210541 type:complete len:225 (-) Transcript_76285:630-1304(-)